MDLKSNPDAKLLHAIHNILLKEWDPLGIRRMPSMRDEYDDYLPNIFKLIRDNSSESEIFEYLWWIENNTTFRGMYMGGYQENDYGNISFTGKNVKGHGALGKLFWEKKKDIKRSKRLLWK